MTYQPKLHECPYITKNGKCTHKHIRKRVSKRKRVCGYQKPKHCDMYCEWLEMSNVSELKRKLISTPISSPSELNHKRFRR